MGEVLQLVMFEGHPITLTDGGAEMIAAQTDLPQLLDRGLGTRLVGEDGAQR